MAVTYLGKEKGVPVNLVSRLMHVDPCFVTTHSKLPEKNGSLRVSPPQAMPGSCRCR